jgi:hypothetical protein
MGKNQDPDPEWVKIKIRIQDEHPGAYFFGLKLTKSLKTKNPNFYKLKGPQMELAISC